MNLSCIFLHHENPFLKIGPFKYEFLNKGPSIGFVHDMISNRYVTKLKQDSRSTLKSTPYNSGEGYSTYSRWRTSKVTYINEKLNWNANKISQNIKLVTKCFLKDHKYDSENFQVSQNIKSLTH